MPRKLKVCFVQPEGGAVGADPARTGDDVAAAERVDNVRLALPPRRPGRPSAAIEKFKLWEIGRTVRCRFLDGDPTVQAKVETIAKEWEDVVNLRLQFVAGGAAEIRISFREQGFSWSTVGTDALTVPRTQPTMNYGWLEPTTSLREYQRVVRHEFGHALGMIHEHQNPDAAGKIPWDKPKVYAYYAQQGWSRDDVDFNIFDTYDADATNFTTFDPTSIMQYAISDSLTVGSYSVGWNTALSEHDHAFMRSQYPADAPSTVELTVGGDRHAADVTAGGEVDTYTFTVPAPATHIMTTEGATDTVLTLHGPDDAGAVLAWDDDLGQGRNARIVRKLLPGSYWLSVRHRTDTGTGPYTIGVKTPEELTHARYGAVVMGLFRKRIDPAELERMQAEIASLREALQRQGSATVALEGRLDGLPAAPPDHGPRVDAVAEQVAALDARITSVTTELANQLTELGHDIDALGERPPAPGTDAAVVGELRDGQVRLATEQARYQIAFREDLARLAEQLKRRS